MTFCVFAIDGVKGVYLGPDFVTVSKPTDLEWADLAPPIVAAIKAWVSEGHPALGDAWELPDFGESGETVEKIRRILETDIRPYVAQVLHFRLQSDCCGVRGELLSDMPAVARLGRVENMPGISLRRSSR